MPETSPNADPNAAAYEPWPDPDDPSGREPNITGYVEPEAFFALSIPVPYGEDCDEERYMDVVTEQTFSGDPSHFQVGRRSTIERLLEHLPQWDLRAAALPRRAAAVFWDRRVNALDNVVHGGWLTSEEHLARGERRRYIGFGHPEVRRLFRELRRRRGEAEDDAILEEEEGQHRPVDRPATSGAPPDRIRGEFGGVAPEPAAPASGGLASGEVAAHEALGAQGPRLNPVDARNAHIRKRYPELMREKGGRGPALAALEIEVASCAEAEGWRPIGQRQILGIAKHERG